MEERVSEAFEVARERDFERLQQLLTRTPEAASFRNEIGTPLLHVTAELNDVRSTELLLEAGADLEAEAAWGQTAFEWAANMGSGETAELLRARGAERLNLWTASALGDLDEVRARCAAGGVEPGVGRTPREGADLSGWPEDTPFLKGDAVSDAFYIACRNGHLEVAKLLREAGAEIEATGYFGATALHWAAINGHAEVVRWLVSEGADPSRRDPKFDGDAPGWAREGGHASLAEELDQEG